jgi:hypothetical protein
MRYFIYCGIFCCAFYLNGFSEQKVSTPPCDQETDTSLGAGIQEDDFQNNINAFYDSSATSIDTFAWNTKKINSGRFDWSAWNDTTRIVLTDSSVGKRFVPPFKNCVTSDFGPRKWLFHYGIDIRLRKGDPVNCAFDGIVRVIENDRHGYGKVVVVRHTGGMETIYGHLSKTLVTINQALKAGEIVGLGGNSGRSTGSHLHFETRFYGQAFDPNDIIDFETFSLKSDTLVLSKANFEYLTEAHKITWHIVKRGETLGRLARHFHTTVAMLCQLNNVAPHRPLKAGQKLAIKTVKRNDDTFTLQPKTPKNS